MLDEKREKFKKAEKFVGGFFSKFGIAPNYYSILSILFAFCSFYFITKKDFISALIFFIFAFSMDLIDGAVARAMKKATKEGAYIDTVCDRYVEAIILFGFLFLPLPSVFLPAKAWIFLAFFGSLMTTYSKAAAKEKELVKSELRKGFLGRAERIILIFSAMCFGFLNLSLLIYPIILLAIFSNITALQRIYLTLSPR